MVIVKTLNLYFGDDRVERSLGRLTLFIGIQQAYCALDIWVGLKIDHKWRPTTLFRVFRRKDNRVIGLKSFGVVCETGLAAFGMKTIRELSLGCGSLSSVNDLKDI